MKTINATLNKLVAYAGDCLMLDALDEVYTLNRLATLCKADAPERTDIAVDKDLDGLLEELKAAVPDVDVCAVLDTLMPAAHTIDYYFGDELQRNRKKAFDFLYELFECGGCVNKSEATGKDGFLHYTHAPAPIVRSVMIDAGDPLPYAPLVSGDRIAALPCEDILSSDIVSRLGAYVAAYGGTIAKRIGGDSEYMCCKTTALSCAKTKKQLKDGAVKVAAIEYPVPVLAFSGIAKNAVEREVARVIKAADGAGFATVAACAEDKPGIPVFYIIFAGEIKGDEIKVSDALAACGVFATADYSPLLPVLEKGTALANDLAEFKSVYAAVGGVKLGAKAKAALDEAVIKACKTALAGAASATEEQAAALTTDQQ